MTVQNTTYINHSIAISDQLMMELIALMRTDYSGLFITASVVLDFIASLFATFFTHRFYQCIEISHPLYAVIFMDIVISTATSYLACILFLVNTIVDSDIITSVDYGFSTISLFNNISSFMMIAFIRYYLLVHAKTNKDEEEIDMMRVKNISLILNSVIFIIILLIREGLYTASFLGYDVKLALIASGFCLAIIPLVTTLILNRKIDNFLKTEHDEHNLNVNNPSKGSEEIKYASFHNQSLEERRGSIGKNERKKRVIPDIASSSSRGIENLETPIKHSRYAWDCKPEAGSSTSHDYDRETQIYGGIYVGDTSVNSLNSANMNKKDVKCSTNDVNLLPNQVMILEEERMHVIESNDLSEDKSVSLNSNDNIEQSENSKSSNSNIQNNMIDVDENAIEVLETIDDEAANSSSLNNIFPSGPDDNTADAIEVYNDSREHKSISKFVTVTFFLLIFSILSIAFIRSSMELNFSTITNIIIFMIVTIIIKLFRTFLVISSSIYCFELIRSLFFTITNETVEFFQSVHNRFIGYF